MSNKTACQGANMYMGRKGLEYWREGSLQPSGKMHHNIMIMSSYTLCKAIRMGFDTVIVPSQDIPSSGKGAVADPLVYVDDSPLDRQKIAIVYVFRQYMTRRADSTAIAGHERHVRLVSTKPNSH